ncbi:outer membrane protein with beta-barrel domain [Sinobacterium caligoides]|uniref:Outer membrane protein with beta-barrel domain n=1 Tax=Sinobacterium caligoides TaxID=933926 RepID=A0A3N2DKJ2_9GAMM|nr:outer membrane beta-barrel protein [Sinobacterium caligoides]ROS00222.1 outer membrane protein with beta-barrel domain [Sinobacterium caligoides]
MKKIFLGLFALSTTLPTLALADSGFSAELLMGTSDQSVSMDRPPVDATEDFDLSDKALSYGIRGTYAFNDYFAIEAAYMDYGSVEQGYGAMALDVHGMKQEIGVEQKLSSRALNAGVKGSYPLTQRLSINGRLGASYWTMKQETGINASISFDDIDIIHAFGPTNTESDSGVGMYYGVGLQYDFTKRFFMAAEYSMTSMEADFGHQSVKNDIDNLALSVGFKF